MDPESSNDKLTYEEVRLKMIEENRRRLKELGLLEKASVFKKRYSKVTTPRKAVKSTLNLEPIEIRRSPRVAARNSRVNYNETKLMTARGDETPRRRSKRQAVKRGYISSTAVTEAALKAGEIVTEHPSFVKIMLKSHVSGGFWLGLPAAFCDAHFRKDDLVILEDEEGFEWETVYLHHKKGLSGGWRGFSLDHHLKDGDALVFELVKPTRFKMYIIRASNIEKHDPDQKFATSKKYVYVLKENKENEHVNSPLHKVLKREQLEREGSVSAKKANSVKPSRKRKLDLSGPHTTYKSRGQQDIQVESAVAEVSKSDGRSREVVVGSPESRQSFPGRILQSRGSHTMEQSQEQQDVQVESGFGEVSNSTDEPPREVVGSPESSPATLGRILRSRRLPTMDQSREQQDTQADEPPREVVGSPESSPATLGRILRSRRLPTMDQSREQQDTQADEPPREVVGSPESSPATLGRILRSRRLPTMDRSREQQDTQADEPPREVVGSPESSPATLGRILRSRRLPTMDQSREQQDTQADEPPREVVRSPGSRLATLGRILRSRRLHTMDQSREQQDAQVESVFGEVSNSEHGYLPDVKTHGSPESRHAKTGHRILRSQVHVSDGVAKSAPSMESRTLSSCSDGVVKSATSMESRTRSSGSEQNTQNKCRKNVPRLNFAGKAKPVAFGSIGNNVHPETMPSVNTPDLSRSELDHVVFSKIPDNGIPRRMPPMKTSVLPPRSKPKPVAFCSIANMGKPRMAALPINTIDLSPRTKHKPVAFCRIANNGKPTMLPPEYLMTLPGSSWKPLPERRLICEGGAPAEHGTSEALPPEYTTSVSGSSVKPMSTISDSSVKPICTRRAK